MTSISGTLQLAALQSIIEKTLDPKSKQMREFNDALLASDISKLFFNAPDIGTTATKTKTKTKKSNSEKIDKPKRTMNAYMIYLNEKRAEIKECLLEQTPDLKGRELANKVTEIAGAAWTQSTEEEKKPYLAKAAALKSPSVAVVEPEIIEVVAETAENDQNEDEAEEEVQHEEDDDTVKLRKDEKLGVWIDDETNLYYGTNDADQAPLGQVQKNKLVAFKKSK